MKQVEIKGIIPPVVTPMNPADESVNIPELRNQIERQIAGGVHGIFPFGPNAEAYILSMKEKEEILEATVDQLKAGGAGGVAGRANLWPGTIASIYDHFVSGDLEKAQAAQDAIVALQRVFKFGNPNTIIKKGVAMMGYPVGECRRPFSYLCDEGVEELKKVLEETKNLC